MSKIELQNIIIKQLEEQKIEDIICIDISRISSLANYIIIGSGRSGKHAESSMENLKMFLKQKQGINGKLSGNGSDGWIVLDLGNVIVHLFESKVRKLYKLDELLMSKIKEFMKKEEKKNAKKVAVKKTVAKTTAKKVVAVKKNDIKTTATKKAVAKKTVVKKAKKTVAKKVAVKKTINKKPTIKKATRVKKTVVKKTTKSVVKKATKRK